MEKINSITKRQIMNIAKACDGTKTKYDSVMAKIAVLQAEADSYKADMEAFEAPIIAKTGYRATDLVVKVITPTINPDGTQKYSAPDKNGKVYALKTTKWVWKYGENIIPTEVPSNETVDNMTVPESADTQMGSDFDKDTELL